MLLSVTASPSPSAALSLTERIRQGWDDVVYGVSWFFTNLSPAFVFALVGLALGGVVGLGTVICAFLVGPAAQLFFPISQRLCEAALAQFAGVRSQT